MGQSSTSRNCPVCNRNEATPFLEKGSLKLVQCASCRMVFADRVETEFSSGDFYDQIGAGFYLSTDKLTGDYEPVRYERELKFFRQYCQKGRVLDVGCSSGGFLHVLTHKFPGDYAAFGTDVSSAPLDYAEQKGINVLRGNFLELPPESEPWDAITFWAVLEHVAQPRQFVRQALNLLNPGGFCFVLVPNLDSLAFRLLRGKYRYVLPQHINYFTHDTLRKLFPPRLQPMAITTSHFNPMVIAKDFLSAKPPADQDRARLLSQTNKLKKSTLLKPIKWIYQGVEGSLRMFNLADNCLMVFQKRL